MYFQGIFFIEYSFFFCNSLLIQLIQRRLNPHHYSNIEKWPCSSKWNTPFWWIINYIPIEVFNVWVLKKCCIVSEQRLIQSCSSWEGLESSKPNISKQNIQMSNSILWCRLLQQRFCKSYLDVGLIGGKLLLTFRWWL